MNSRCTPTTWAPKSRAPATLKQRKPLTPTMASRCWRWRVEGLAEAPGVDEQVGPADGERHQAESAAPAGRSCRCRPRRRSRARSTTTPARRRPARAGSSQIRIAIRPTRRLPATSCADPGSTRVISISVTARRNRTRWARSSVVNRVCVRPGGRDGRHRGPFVLGEVSPTQYHQSHPSQPGATRRSPQTVGPGVKRSSSAARIASSGSRSR